MQFGLSSGGGAIMLEPVGRGPRAAVPARTAKTTKTTGSGMPGDTGEAAERVPLDAADGPVDPAVRARARQIAARLSLRRPIGGTAVRRGSGELVSLRYRGGADEIDLDRTIDVLAERPFPEDEDIVVRERVRTRRTVVLVVDVSGSMRGERVHTAAATVGALAGELRADDLAVIAFWSDAAVLLPLGARFAPLRLLDTLLRLPAQGLTNVGFPLRIAAAELGRRPSPRARVLLLSDCVHNAGPDPRAVAARLPRLDVLLDASGEKDLELGRDLAHAGRGRMFAVRHHREVAPALSTIFGS
jgi:Mg-chelatase subunit ChlD